jgi:predicted ATPase/class 3 adenylate cyclase
MHNPRSLSGTEPMDGTPTGTVTFLFTDIEGSTKRWETDPASMRAASSREEAILRHAIGANGGYAYKMIGDAFQAAFPTAPQALQAALDAQLALRSENWPAEAGELKVRMALHTGATEERGDDYVGPALNRVARILSAAHGGQTLLSQVTHELVRDALPPDVRLVDMGEHRLKDLTRPEHIFQIVAPGLQSDFPPLKTLENRPNNLPLQPTPLIGRERELGEVAKLLRRAEVLLVTLTGPGGTGKTRVGLQVASDLLDEFPDGVWYVELAALTDAALVAPMIAQTLAVSEVATKPILDTLKAYLREKKLLLVLDNFEQVMDARGAVAALVKAAPDVRVLVTSREKLNVYGEHEYAVPPLSLPDMKALPPLEKLTQYEAVELFIERARAAKADFEVNNDNAAAVAEICVRVDGLPLAIELAAARVKMLPPQALLARLSSSLSGPFKLLTGGARDLSARLQTLRGTIDWSYNLLSDEEKRFFARAAVFQGGRTLEALEAVCSLEPLQAGGNLHFDVLDGVQSLADKSLLRQRDGRDGEVRFWMLETIQEYAREKLEESGEAAPVRREHALYFMRLAEEVSPLLTGEGQLEGLEKLEEEYDNIRAALQWSRETAAERDRKAGAVEAIRIGLRLGEAVGRFWHVRGYYTEGREQLRELLEAAKAVPVSQEEKGQAQAIEISKARVLYWVGVLAYLQGDYASARSVTQDGLAIQQEWGDKQGMGNSLNGLGNVAFEEGDFTSARSLFEESLAIQREYGDKQDMTISLNNLGLVAKEQGDFVLARALYEEGLAIARERRDKRGIGYLLGNLGLMAQEQGEYASARGLYRECLVLFQEVGHKWAIAMALAGLGGVGVGSAGGAGEAGAIGDTTALRRGAVLLGAAAALLQSMDAMLAAEDRRPYERAIELARAQLGKEAFEAAWQEGLAMSMEEAIRYALE